MFHIVSGYQAYWPYNQIWFCVLLLSLNITVLSAMLGLISEAVGHIVRSLSQLRIVILRIITHQSHRSNVVRVIGWRCPGMFLHAPPSEDLFDRANKVLRYTWSLCAEIWVITWCWQSGHAQMLKSFVPQPNNFLIVAFECTKEYPRRKLQAHSLASWHQCAVILLVEKLNT